MAVGHHIHDRAHVIKKSKNNKTGDEEVNQEFINMNESKLAHKIYFSKDKIIAAFLELHGFLLG